MSGSLGAIGSVIGGFFGGPIGSAIGGAVGGALDKKSAKRSSAGSPSPVPPAPGLDTQAVQDAAAEERRLRAGRGAAGNILTSPLGVGDNTVTNTASRRLLGAGY
jgi:hypothetical protein